jgi:hypothetical protein
MPISQINQNSLATPVAGTGPAFSAYGNDSDGKGDYIAKWEHPTLPRPTEEQLA